VDTLVAGRLGRTARRGDPGLDQDRPAAHRASGSTANSSKSSPNRPPRSRPRPKKQSPPARARPRPPPKKEKKAAPPPAAAPAAPEPPPPTPIVSPSVPVKDSAAREIPVPPPANLKLIPLEGQGRLAEVEGELRAAPLINEAPTRYRVVRWQNNRWQILCHVYGEAAKLRSLQDKRVRVKGREYWIQGAAAPVLVPDQIQEIRPVE
jgi:hypothetical protein